MNQNFCIFDIETIPDIDGFKKINPLNEVSDLDGSAFSDSDYFAYMKQQRRAEVGHDFIRHHLQKVVAISVVMAVDDKIKCASLGEINATEKELLIAFFGLIEKYRPVLVSWNGSGFDLPVIHYRALHHQVTAPRYWDIGHFDQNMKWSNYQSRFHYQHIDLMDVISGFQTAARAPLNDICKLCGFPGKLATDGGDVLALYERNDIHLIRDYCDTDVLNTYLVFLRFEFIRGLLNESDYEAEVTKLKAYLSKQNKAHFSEFLTAWENTQ